MAAPRPWPLPPGRLAAELLDGLQKDGLISRRVDDRDRRAQQVTLTARGRELASDAGHILPELECELARRIGTRSVLALREALVHDRGPAPTGRAERRDR